MALKRTYSIRGNSKSLERYTKKRKTSSKGVSRPKGFAGSIMVPRGLQNPFPLQRNVILRYCANVTLDAAVGTIGKWQFRCNSLFDPDVTGTGHQPYGFDTLASIYNHYQVMKSFITIEGVAASVGLNAGNGVAGILVSDDGTTVSDIDTIREVKTSKWTMYDSTNKFTVSNSFDTKTMFPATFQALGANVTANPSEEALFTLWAAPALASVEPGAVYLAVTIDYVCKFWELKDLGQS